MALSSICPSCLSDVEAGDNTVCGRCGASTVVDEGGLRVRLTDIVKGDRGHDSLDGVGALVAGVSAAGDRVIVRLTGSERARLDREATIARGLVHPQVAQVLATTTTATIFSAPHGRTVDDALAGGLRVDGRWLRRFLRSLLSVLRDLEAKSPPVHLLDVHAGNVFVDVDDGSVGLLDFSRATDTSNDSAVNVAARPGMTPSTSVTKNANPPTSAAVDLYAVGVLATQLASRLAPVDLPQRSGRVDVAAAVSLDAALVAYLQLLLNGTFDSKQAALDALLRLDDPKKSSGAAVAIFAAVAIAMVVVPGIVVWRVLTEDPAPIIVVVEPPHVPDVPQVPQVPQIPDVPQMPDVPRVPDAPRAPDLPRARDVPPLPPPPSVDDVLLRAIEAAVRAQQAEIEACPDDGTDRVKLHLKLVKGHGDVKPLTRGDSDGVRCVADSVAESTWPSTPHQKVEADIWVWRHPSFKVAAY